MDDEAIAALEDVDSAAAFLRYLMEEFGLTLDRKRVIFVEDSTGVYPPLIEVQGLSRRTVYVNDYSRPQYTNIGYVYVWARGERSSQDEL